VTILPIATSAREAADWLSLAASPSFAVLAVLAETGRGPDIMSGHGAGSFGDMGLMYGLMALFHLQPWLRRFAGR
jgi:hypothetical protein